MAKVAICMAMAMMYTVLLTRLGSNSLYRSTNCSCLQGTWVSVPFCSGTHHSFLLPPLFPEPHLLLRAACLGLAVQVDQAQEVDRELQHHRKDGVQVEDVGQGPLSGKSLERLWSRPESALFNSEVMLLPQASCLVLTQR